MWQLTFVVYKYMLSLCQYRNETWLWQCIALAEQTVVCYVRLRAVARIRYRNMPLAALICFSTQGLIDEGQRMLLM